MSKIFIIGFMGAGKTKFAKRLGARLNLDTVDLDKSIEQEQEKTIPAIFEEIGEAGFRQLESKSLQDVVQEALDSVVSLGGGTPCSDENMRLIKESGTIIYLKLPKAELLKRLSEDNGEVKRPLLQGVENLERYVSDKLRERERFYLQADVVVDPRFAGVAELAEMLIQRTGVNKT